MAYWLVLPLLTLVGAVMAAACAKEADVPARDQLPPRQAESEVQPTSEPLTQLAPATVQSQKQLSSATDQDAPPKSGQDLDDQPSFFMALGWETDFSKHSVPYREIISGGPRRDGILPIDKPKFVDVSAAPSYMKDNEPVISLEIRGEAKAYPLAMLMRHEIVNDELGGVPVTVTYCPLCNTAIAFDRRLGGRVLDFGTSGNLRNSDLVMWDRQTESWWQQATGEAIVGELTGARLKFLPAGVVSWNQFRQAFPGGRVLSRDIGVFAEGRYLWDYDSPPYNNYDDVDNIPFLFAVRTDPRLKATERVVGLTRGGQAVAYPFKLLKDYPVINDSINGEDVVVFYVGGTLSPFAGVGSSPSRPVGSTAVFEPVLDGRKLTFKVESDVIMDRETGSKWNILGQAMDGPLQGSRLTPVLHGNHFWFAWAAFNPDTVIRTAQEISASAP